MREIKFRQPIFDDNGKFACFHFWGYLRLGEFIGPITPYTPYGPGRSQQYTGPKDKYGKEIYGGDIFKWSLPKGFKTVDSDPFPFLAELLNCEKGALSRRTTEIAIVRWDEKRALWKLPGQGENFGWESALGGEFVDGSHRNQHGEIIGNIFESPGLLEKLNEEN